MSVTHRTSLETAFVSQVPWKKLVKQALPKDFGPQYFSYLEERLQKAVKNAFETLENTPQCVDILPQEKYFRAFLKRDEKEIRLICFPRNTNNKQDFLPRTDGIHEMLASEAVFSIDSQKMSCYTSHVDYGKKKTYDQEIEGRDFLQAKNYPLYRRLSSLWTYDFPDFTLASKGPGYKTLANEFVNNKFSLSAFESLKILRQVLAEVKTLSNQRLVHAYVSPYSIELQRHRGLITGHLNECRYLTQQNGSCEATHPWVNVLAHKNFASADADRFGLIQLLATLFWLQDGVSEVYDVENLEMFALSTIEEEVFPEHFAKVLDLKRQYGGFHKGFSKALLQYVDSLKLQEEEGVQIVVLQQFAEKMALFPQISSLLKKAIEVNEEQQSRFEEGETPITIDAQGPHMPSLRKIGEVLQQGEKNLRELAKSRVKVPTEILQIDKEQIRQLIVKMTHDSTLIDLHTDHLHRVLGQYLQERPEVGSEKRFHKEPFSFRVCVGLKHVFIYPIGSYLGGGNYKTAKQSWCAKFFEGGVSVEDQMVSRARKNNPENIEMHRAILQIPGADKFFVDLPRRHVGYIGSNGKLKWESNRSLYSATLDRAINQLGVFLDPSDPSTYYRLSMQDFISFLDHVAQGIELIAQHQIAHGDIKVANIGVRIVPGESCTALLTDFDLSSYFPAEPSVDSSSYRYWDYRRRIEGEISHITDIYGLVVLMAEVFFWRFRTLYTNKDDQVIQKALREMCQAPQKIKRIFLEDQKTALQRMGLQFCPPITRATCAPYLLKIADCRKAGDIEKSLALQDWLVNALCFERVFGLLWQTLQADQKDSVFAYPSIAVIREILEACRQDAVWVSEESQK